MAKKTKKTKASPKVHHSVDQKSFIIIAGGGLLVLFLFYFFMSDSMYVSKARNVVEDTVKLEEKKMMENTVAMTDMVYSPEAMTVKVGTSVTFTNDDTVEHSATADDGSFDTGMLATGESGSVTFSEPGTYTYHCLMHPQMTGTIVVEE